MYYNGLNEAMKLVIDVSANKALLLKHLISWNEFHQIIINGLIHVSLREIHPKDYKIRMYSQQ